MANHALPTLTSTYTNFVSEVMARITDGLLMLDPANTTATNVPTNAIRWNGAGTRFEKFNGTSWGALSTNIIFQNITIDNGATDGGQISFLSSGNTELKIDNLGGVLRVFDSAELFKVYSASGNIFAKGSATFGGSITAVNGTSEVNIVVGNQTNSGYLYGTAANIGLYSGTSGNKIELGKSSGSSVIMKTGVGSGKIDLYTNATLRFRISENGRVLLGATVPTDNGVDALQINGTISCSSPTSGNQAATADYAIAMAIALG